MLSARSILFSCSLVFIFLAGALHWTPWAVEYKAVCMMVSYAVIFFGLIGVWLSFPDGLSAAQKIGLILLVSLLARIVMVGVPVSDDVYRYLWEGKIVAAGESPYQFPADHAHYKPYRDHFWEGMNHKDKLTAYPPLAELMFAGVSSISYSPWAFKVLFILADLCVVWVLLSILKHRGSDVRAALLYALNPLTLFAFSGEAHFDVVMILAIMLSVLSVEKKFIIWAWVWLGIAIQIKIIAVVLIPLYLLRCHWRHAWWLLIPLALPSLYFLDSLSGMFQGLWAFGGTNVFNGPIHGPINYLLEDNITCVSRIIFVLFGLVSLWILWAVKTPTKAAYLTIASLDSMKPWLASEFLSFAAATNAGLSADLSADEALNSRAARSGKNVIYLETMEDQIRASAELPEFVQLSVLTETMEKFNTLGIDMVNILNIAQHHDELPGIRGCWNI